MKHRACTVINKFILVFGIALHAKAHAIFGPEAPDEQGQVTPAVYLLVHDNGVEKDEKPCTASAITPTHLLTAAHCVSDPLRPVRIYKTKNFARDRKLRRIEGWPIARENIAIHPGYLNPRLPLVSKLEADLAVIKVPARLIGDSPVLELDFSLDDSDLTEINLKPENGLQFLVAGFGGDADDFGYGVLRTTTVEASAISTSPYLAEADQKRGRGICHGDSGAPALRQRNGKWRLSAIGVYVFKVDPIPECQNLGGYVFLAPHRSWLAAEIKRLS